MAKIERGLAGEPVRIRLAVSIRVYGLREVYTWLLFTICQRCWYLELHPTILTNIYLIRRLSGVDAFPAPLHIYILPIHIHNGGIARVTADSASM